MMSRQKLFGGCYIFCLSNSKLYFTATTSIFRADMDVTNFEQVTRGLTSASGITIDIHSSRLYWADEGARTIRSSNTDGSDVQTIVQFPSDTHPTGIITFGDTVYWGTWGRRSLQSCTKTGGNVRSLYDGNSNFMDLTLISSKLGANLLENVTNPCAAQVCSHLCALKPKNTFRCLCPNDKQLLNDQNTCVHIDISAAQ